MLYNSLASVALHLLSVFVWLSRVCIMADGHGPPLKKKRLCHFNPKWIEEFSWIIKVASSKFLTQQSLGHFIMQVMNMQDALFVFLSFHIYKSPNRLAVP